MSGQQCRPVHGTGPRVGRARSAHLSAPPPRGVAGPVALDSSALLASRVAYHKHHTIGDMQHFRAIWYDRCGKAGGFSLPAPPLGCSLGPRCSFGVGRRAYAPLTTGGGGATRCNPGRASACQPVSTRCS
jgi:hypothetical protein